MARHSCIGYEKRYLVSLDRLAVGFDCLGAVLGCYLDAALGYCLGDYYYYCRDNYYPALGFGYCLARGYFAGLGNYYYLGCPALARLVELLAFAFDR